MRAALDDKLRKYSFPVIVALQGIETGDLFTAAEEVLFGSEVVQVPIDPVTGGPAGPPRAARKNDSSVSRRDSDGARVRARLEALLPFEILVTERGFVVRARVLANPARPGVVGLEEFRPIPTLRQLGPGMMGYFGPDGHPHQADDHVPDQFVP